MPIPLRLRQLPCLLLLNSILVLRGQESLPAPSLPSKSSEGRRVYILQLEGDSAAQRFLSPERAKSSPAGVQQIPAAAAQARAAEIQAQQDLLAEQLKSIGVGVYRRYHKL